eukprot:TRINITY_DN3037_c0_g1_i1.p1 TRINITY_DN3037_c0_g1~~TRINITY_DN3037_c0_g1_i1.p1  ORF type:complete len:453 (-),score=103.04 TRINITY_DN3037_c0_g1_i1:26-1345(-)
MEEEENERKTLISPEDEVESREGLQTTQTSSQTIPKEEEEEEQSVEDYADVVVAILWPVAITMALVVLIVKSSQKSEDSSGGGSYISFGVYAENVDDSWEKKLGGALLNALIFVVMVVVVTVILVLLYKYRCIKVIWGWLFCTSGLMLGLFTLLISLKLFSIYGIDVDVITYFFLLWNFSVIGLLSIFYFAPQRLNQGYLIVISVLLAYYFTRWPEWTSWCVLGAIALYDVFAVLCPNGPLRVLVEMAQQRQEPIPALLYNGSVIMTMTQFDDDDEEEDHQSKPLAAQSSISPSTSTPQLELTDNITNNSNNTTTFSNNREGRTTSPIRSNEERDSVEDADLEAQGEESKKRGVKLGLGDFIFYSVLIGRAALYDVLTIFTCFVAIITGLFFTLLLLAVFKKALPALPISIFLGIVFFFLSKIFLLPYVLTLGLSPVFI